MSVRYISEDIKVDSWYKSLEFRREKAGLEFYIWELLAWKWMVFKVVRMACLTKRVCGYR